MNHDRELGRGDRETLDTSDRPRGGVGRDAALLPTDRPIRVIGYIGTDSTMNLAVRERILAFLDAGLRAGTIKPTNDHVFDFDDIVEAHRYLESNDQFGKVVVRL